MTRNKTQLPPWAEGYVEPKHLVPLKVRNRIREYRGKISWTRYWVREQGWRYAMRLQLAGYQETRHYHRTGVCDPEHHGCGLPCGCEWCTDQGELLDQAELLDLEQDGLPNADPHPDDEC